MARNKYNVKGTPKQDLTAARAELKQFRHDVALLKRKGLLNKKYDARSVNPTKYLKGVIKEFGNVLRGEAQPVKVNKQNKKYYSDNGYKTKGNRVIVPVQKNEKAYATKTGIRIKATGQGGSITKIDVKLDRKNINEWATQLKNVGIKLKDDEVLTFQFFGNNSHAAFENLHRKTAWEAMAEYIQNYPAFEQTEDKDPDKQQEFIDNVTIFKIRRNNDGKIIRPQTNYLAKERTEEMRRRDSIRNQERRNRFLNNMSPEQEARYHAERAKLERERRALMKTRNPDEITRYREQAKIRAEKSRQNKKAKQK
jgi:hypothetical protein